MYVYFFQYSMMVEMASALCNRMFLRNYVIQSFVYRLSETKSEYDSDDRNFVTFLTNLHRLWNFRRTCIIRKCVYLFLIPPAALEFLFQRCCHFNKRRGFKQIGMTLRMLITNLLYFFQVYEVGIWLSAIGVCVLLGLVRSNRC